MANEMRAPVLQAYAFEPPRRRDGGVEPVMPAASHAIEPATTSRRWRRASTPSSRCATQSRRWRRASTPSSRRVARDDRRFATQARAGVQEGRGRREVWKHRGGGGKEDAEAREINKKSDRGAEEVSDLSSEFQREREEMLDTIRQLARQIKLKDLILEGSLLLTR